MLEYVNATTSVSARRKCRGADGHSDRFRARQKAARRPCAGHIVYGHGHGTPELPGRSSLRVGGQGAPLTPGRVHPSRELLRCRIAQIVRRLIIFGQRFEAGLSPLSVV